MPLKDYDKKVQKSIDTKPSAETESEHDEAPPAKRQRVDDVQKNKSSSSDNKSNSNSSPEKQTDASTSMSKNNRKKNKKGKMIDNKPQSSSQTSNKPVEFDYSKVDFKKFQGGSQRPQQSLDIKTKFMGKVSSGRISLAHSHLKITLFLLLQGKNSKANKQFNKLFKFSTSNKKK